MTAIYTIADINNIIFKGFPYRLPEQNMKILSDLEKLMGGAETSQVKAKTYEKKPIRNTVHSSSHSSSSQNNDDDWSVVRTNFKPTKIDVKEGIEKEVNIIRTSLNKISVKNFESHRSLIVDFITTFLKNQSENAEISEEDRMINTRKIGHSIFDIASTNKNNSALYASLYLDLISRFEIFTTILSEFVGNFKTTIQTIIYVSPDENYDQFCAYTKSNDSRKSTTLFLVNLMKLDLVSHHTVIDIIQHFQDTVFQYIDESNRTNEVEEIIENLFILIVQSNLKMHEKWGQIVDIVKTISTMKLKEHQSLTNRAVFKCLDILDNLA